MISQRPFQLQIGILGDNSVGVDINANIGGYYRQRGDIDVRGEGSVGIDIDANIGGALLVETGVNATGYSLIVAGSGGHRNADAIFQMMILTKQRSQMPIVMNAVKAAPQLIYHRPLRKALSSMAGVNRIGTTAEADEFTCLVENEDSMLTDC